MNYLGLDLMQQAILMYGINTCSISLNLNYFALNLMSSANGPLSMIKRSVNKHAWLTYMDIPQCIFSCVQLQQLVWNLRTKEADNRLCGVTQL